MVVLEDMHHAHVERSHGAAPHLVCELKHTLDGHAYAATPAPLKDANAGGSPTTAPPST